MILVVVGLAAFTIASQRRAQRRAATVVADQRRGARGTSGLRGWLPPPTREPDPGNAGGGIDMEPDGRGHHRSGAARPARRRRRPPRRRAHRRRRRARPRPGGRPRADRARRRPRLDLGARAWRGRRSTPRSSATRSTRRRPTPSWRSPTPPRTAPSASCSSPVRATASTTPSPRSARSAHPASPASASLEAWWGNDQLHVVHGPGSTDARPAGGDDVLGDRHARPVRRRHASRAPDGRCCDHPLAPLVGLGVSNQVDAVADHGVGGAGHRHRRSSPERRREPAPASPLLLAVAAPSSACGDDDPAAITLVVYDSFPDVGHVIERGARRVHRGDRHRRRARRSPATPGRWCPRPCSPPATRRAT